MQIFDSPVSFTLKLTIIDGLFCKAGEPALADCPLDEAFEAFHLGRTNSPDRAISIH